MEFWHKNGSPNHGQTIRPSNKQQQKIKIKNFVVPTEHRIKLKENENTDKYLDFAKELKKNCGTWKWPLY